MRAVALAIVLASGAAAAGTFPLSQIRVTARVADGTPAVLAESWPCGTNGDNVTPVWTAGGGDALYERPFATAMLERVAGEERLVVTDRGAELQRKALGEVGRIPLRVVAHVTPGIDVYAYTTHVPDEPAWDSVVYLLASFPEGAASFAVDVASGGESTISGMSRGVGCGIWRPS